jgi:pimeloyl-ACP methyl ester carboxylesterase
MAVREINGVGLLVEQSGGGEQPLVLVHGSWDDRRTWAFVEEDLGRGFRVVTYDRRGHSGSADGPGPDSRRDDEDDLAALIETLGLGPASVAGSGFGGVIALGLAARRPELFRTLTLHEPPLVALAADDPVVLRMGEAIGSVAELIGRGEAEAAARQYAENVAFGPGGWEMLPRDRRDTMIENAGTFAGEVADPEGAGIDLGALRSLPMPVLLTQGDQSPPFFAAIVARLAATIGDAEIETIPGAGHVPHQTHPDDYVAIVRRFAGSG